MAGKHWNVNTSPNSSAVAYARQKYTLPGGKPDRAYAEGREAARTGGDDPTAWLAKNGLPFGDPTAGAYSNGWNNYLNIVSTEDRPVQTFIVSDQY